MRAKCWRGVGRVGLMRWEVWWGCGGRCDGDVVAGVMGMWEGKCDGDVVAGVMGM